MKYEVGETYSMSEKPAICKNGFHYCPKLVNCFTYYEFDPRNKVAEVEILGDIDVIPEGDKECTNKIKIVREIKWHEVLDLVNIGENNTGKCNTGNRNTGDYNTGSDNAGYYNTGSSNAGNYNAGYYNTGNYNTGYYNTGDCNISNGNTGIYNAGGYNTGDCNISNGNTGIYNTGGYNTGYRNTSKSNAGDYNTGRGNVGNYNTGEYNSCDYSTGFFNSVEQPIYLFNKKQRLQEMILPTLKIYALHLIWNSLNGSPRNV